MPDRRHVLRPKEGLHTLKVRDSPDFVPHPPHAHWHESHPPGRRKAPRRRSQDIPGGDGKRRRFSAVSFAANFFDISRRIKDSTAE
jgi:hypothetical protein